MKIPVRLLLVWILLIVTVWSQAPKDIVGTQEWKWHQDRQVLIPYLMSELRGTSEKELMQNAGNPGLHVHGRIASALLLLREHESGEAHVAALQAFSLKMSPVKISEWEGGMSLKLQWPVAYAASFRPELMPNLIQGGLNGIYNVGPMGIVLRHYQVTGDDPRPLLLKLRESAANPTARELCDRMLSELADDKEINSTSNSSRVTDEEAAWALPVKGLPPGFKQPTITFVVKPPNAAPKGPAQAMPEPKTAEPPPAKAAPQPEAPIPIVPAPQDPPDRTHPATNHALLWFASGFAACGILVLLLRRRR